MNRVYSDKAKSVLFYFSLCVNRSTYSVYDVLIKILAEPQLAFYWEVALKELLCRSFYYSFIALRCKQSRKKHSLKLFAGVVSLWQFFSAVCICGGQSCNPAADLTRHFQIYNSAVQHMTTFSSLNWAEVNLFMDSEEPVRWAVADLIHKSWIAN